MGGCRCTFRGCENSTQRTPSFHFFHFPVKHAERLEKWIQFSNNKSFIGLQQDKLKNKVVCQEHFRLSMFMNIKRERLIRSAIPTLLRIRSGELIDLELVKSCFETISVESRLQDVAEGVNCCVPSEEVRYEEDDEERMDEMVEPIPVPSWFGKEETPSGKPILLNFSLNAQQDEEVMADFVTDPPTPKVVQLQPQFSLLPDMPSVEFSQIRLTKVKMKKRPAQEQQQTGRETKLIKIPEVDESTVPKIISVESAQEPPPLLPPKPKMLEKGVQANAKPLPKIINVQSIPEQLPQPPPPSPKPKMLEKGVQVTAKPSPVKIDPRLVKENEKLLVERKSLKKCLQERETEAEKLKSQIDQLKSDLEEQRKKKEAPAPTPPTEKPTNLSKAQLFNQVKRYLSNSMVTLLRMEMFGDPEREWKVDERKLACELLGLGPSVYKHFKDEWRIRVPPTKQVEEWRTQNTEDDEEDL